MPCPGVTASESENLLGVIARYRKSVYLIARAGVCRRSSDVTTSAIPGSSDEQIISSSISANNGGTCHFLTCVIQDLLTTLRKHPLPPVAQSSGPVVNSELGEVVIEPPAAVRQALDNLNGQVERLYESCASNTLFLCTSGHSPEDLKALHAEKNAASQWTDVDEGRIRAMQYRMTQGVLFATVKP